MINFAEFTTTKEEFEIMGKIIDRANPSDRMSLSMDLEVVHNTVVLDLERLLNAPDYDFHHDINGIRRHLDRQSGELKDCFYPRYAHHKEIK